MKSSNQISEELKNISSLLAGIDKKNIFSAPEGYFEELSMDILKTINNNAAELKTDKLTVPEGYFENLSTLVLNKIKSFNDDSAQELRALSPMLYSIQNENVFEVPTGYFRNLENDVLNKIIAGPIAKVVSIKKTDSIWKYAAAAVITGIIGLSSLMMFNTSRQSAVSKVNELSVVQTASQFKSEQQINEAIAMLPDDEIIKYLERNSSDVDNEILTTDIDQNELPATKDYLLEEKTLDLYLNKIDQENAQN